ncbi:MAG: M13 family peptidase [Proteobacteria bacterium]|uniref:M13 family metallopeptidase n=1 Tax=Rudaea sp. TaxID=2136325 RepID=UPI00321FA005|nr:M13 family peptidase [Pseudomonadota bacterium]
MKRTLVWLACAGFIAACSQSAPPPAEKAPAPAAAAPTPPPLTSGVTKENMDTAVRAQDDFYRYVNGHWLDAFQIPDDRPMSGAFVKLDDEAKTNIRAIIEDAAAKPDPANKDKQKIADLYASFMDEAALEGAGLKPLEVEFARIDALKDKKEIPALVAHFLQIGATAPFGSFVHQDNKDSTKYVVDLQQDGLGLPDRDYYLENDAKLKQIREAYAKFIEKMLAMSGDKAAAANAKAMLALETELARVQWTKVQLRDPIKGYNKESFADLAKLAPGYDWKSFLVAAGIEGKTDYVIVGQPSYFSGMDKILAKTPLATLKTYFRWQLLRNYAKYLNKDFVDARFAFYGTELRGVPADQPRWKRGVGLTEGLIGEAVGKLYVAKHFPPESKARMDQLVKNLLAAYQQSIDTLDWMSAETKKAAQEKLAKFMPKIGYPDKWRDYSSLEIKRDDLVGNVMRGNAFEYQRNIDKLGKPVDRAEWGMTPQTVNAYYNPELNEIVFPAAILQPPFFDAKADDAVNYGGIGAVIGHEISHGFDDQGSQYDGDGNLRDWWTAADHEKFAAKTKALVAQYAAFEPVPGYHLNGELTLGENIADNSGLAIAYKAYQISLGGKPAPTLDGFSGDQRVYIGWAQAWQAKVRDKFAIELIKSDPHSLPVDRVLGTLANQAPFYDAFGVKQGDKMYVAPEKRVTIW